MTIAIIAPKLKVASWVKRLTALDPGLDIRVWPEIGEAREIQFALTWDHPLGEFKKLKNLKCIASLGVGVDHILRDPDLPPGTPITRVVEPSMAQYMSEYIILAVLNHCRHFDEYRIKQARGRWKPRLPRFARDTRVGVMGLGQLGGEAAKKLRDLGFQVAGWSRTPKKILGVAPFAGPGTFDDFLSRTDILVCLLPLTPATRGILNRETFEKLPQGAYIINAARGKHLVEEDLLDALASGRLSGACLDVFRTEPPPPDHPFWSHPKIIATPHISSITNPKTVTSQIVENYHRVQAGQPPLHMVDVERGY
ncbi:MAG: glyoxylate/hydroxypyruvate reductase A [Desulfobacterales bacterium]|nr:glyoxylate/hydroxypyruvate reductase A [Desulfobacterales bacterium]